jgi:hypothetical protein
MSNLDNVYLSCPGLMSDGRSQKTDYTSHNELFKKMKGSNETSYDFREKLQASGLRDITDDIRYNTCSQVPAGDIVLPREIKLNTEGSGSFLDSFGPLSSNTFFNMPVENIVVKNPELTLPASKTPNGAPVAFSVQNKFSTVMQAVQEAQNQAANSTPNAQANQLAQAQASQASKSNVAFSGNLSNVPVTPNIPLVRQPFTGNMAQSISA